MRSETATIAGACQKPGVYGISNSTHLADLYAMAGASATRLTNGSVVDIADLDNSVVIRGDEILPVDIRRAVEKGDALHNIRIRRGDYIHIAQSLESSVTVCGEVKAPCRRVFVPGMGLLETLTEAGWISESHWSHVIIIRDGLVHPKMYKVDIDGILAGRCRNIALKAGDIVYVPRDNLAEYNVFVKYSVGGREYESELGIFSGNTKVGDPMKVYYNPEDPGEVVQMRNQALIPYICIGVGALALIGGIISIVKAMQKIKRLRQQEEEWGYGN